jgi:hypothetical protein
MLQPSSALQWVLLRAFAPVGCVVPRALDSATVVALCRSLDLAPRIATRHAQTLSAELGPEAARQLTFERLRVVGVDRLLWTLASEVLEAAAQLSCPVVLMKHAALRRCGALAEGERAARDVDVLAPTELAGALQQALVERRFVSSGGDPRFHLPPLKRGPGEVVEIHTALWGVRLPGVEQGPEGARAERLIADRFAERFDDGAYVPTRPVLAVHAIVHGLIQHRTSPKGYPIMRVLADLCALDLADADAAERCRALAASDIDGELVVTAIRLSQALNRGTELSELQQQPAVFELLGHVVAACCDPVYQRALRFERLGEMADLTALRRAWKSAFSSPEGASAELSARAAHPLGLAFELARGAASYAELRFRRR